GVGSSFPQKDCPNPFCLLFAVVTTAAPARAAGATALGRHLAVYGGRLCGRCPYGLAVGKRRPMRAGCGWWPLLAALAVAGWPCKGPGYGCPPPFLAVFAVKNAARMRQCKLLLEMVKGVMLRAHMLCRPPMASLRRGCIRQLRRLERGLKAAADDDRDDDRMAAVTWLGGSKKMLEKATEDVKEATAAVMVDVG
ncbi:hypothetical protein GW17_00060988, partial [Ensete ventricosum]